MPKESAPKPKVDLAESGYKDALRRLLSRPPGEYRELEYELDFYEQQLTREVTARISAEVTEELESVRKSEAK